MIDGGTEKRKGGQTTLLPNTYLNRQGKDETEVTVEPRKPYGREEEEIEASIH